MDGVDGLRTKALGTGPANSNIKNTHTHTHTCQLARGKGKGCAHSSTVGNFLPLTILSPKGDYVR